MGSQAKKVENHCFKESFQYAYIHNTIIENCFLAYGGKYIDKLREIDISERERLSSYSFVWTFTALIVASLLLSGRYLDPLSRAHRMNFVSEGLDFPPQFSQHVKSRAD